MRIRFGRLLGITSLFVMLFILFSACEAPAPITAVAVVGDDFVMMQDNPTYTVVISPSSRQGAAVTWRIEAGTGSASISATGVMTPQSPGTVTVVAKAGDIEGTLEVEIVNPITGLILDGPEWIALDGQGTYTYAPTPADATYTAVEWAVLAGTGNATITQQGVVTPIAAGTVTVRLNIDGILATKVVAIIVPVTDVGIGGPAEVPLGGLGTYEKILTPEHADFMDVSWGVEAGTGAATITQEGVLSPVAAGTVTVTLDVDGVTATYPVEIIIPVASVTVTGPESVLPGTAPEYEATVLPEDAKYPAVTWSVVPGTGAATINQAGVLTPTASGMITVVATADGVQGTLEVEIEADDRMLGTPRPPHILATPENTKFIDGVWEKEGILEGLDVEFARQVYDVSFTTQASISPEGVVFKIDNSYDLSRMQYIAIKVTGETDNPAVNPTIGFRLRDFNSGVTLFWDQDTEVEVTEANQWIVFRISARYFLQDADRDLRIVLDPHFTASGNAGSLTIQQVAFFGDAEPVVEPQVLGPFQTAHWAQEPTASPATDEIDGVMVDVTHIEASLTAVSNWWGVPAYVRDDITRYTHITFKVRLLTEGLTANPRLLVTLGDTDLQNISIDRANTTDYTTVTVPIPANLRTEANMWAVRYVQVKVNSATAAAVEYYIYDLKLTGDADPTPIEATRTDLGGPNVPLTGNINYVENGTAVPVPANDDPAHILFSPNDNETLAKLEFGYSKTTGNAAARSGLNGVFVKIQGPAGITINIQQGWGDGWADESQRMFVLDGTVQEIYIMATPRSLVTTGTGWFPFQFNAFLPEEMTDVDIKIYEFAFTAILPEEEPVKQMVIPFSEFVMPVVDLESIVTDGTVVTVMENDPHNHVRAYAISRDLRYMNTLTLELQGEVGTSVTIKLAYGNMFNFDVDYVHTFTSDDVETIVIDITDRDALLASILSVSLFFDIGEHDEPVDFQIFDAYFSGVIPAE
ncbi:MAG: hypothetical protein EA374_02470 [Acholeplasmatales bacterium]|nr:MAG: hypothetical protein EA374_02470 [Acholeplasmatales bacterium]